MAFNFAVPAVIAQVNDLGGVEYTAFLNADNDPDISFLKVSANIPTKIGDRGHYILNGIGYTNVSIDFKTEYSFDTAELGNFHIIEYTFGYTFPMNTRWRFTAQLNPAIASNLRASLGFDDLAINGSIIFIRSLEGPKKNRLTLGLAYSQTSGIPFPLPFITYFREITQNLSYTIGVPITKFKYYLGRRRNSVEGFLRLSGFFSNLSNPVAVNGQEATAINLSGIVAGIGYDRYIGKRFNLFFKAGYFFRDQLQLNDENRDEIFDFNLSDTFYTRGGFQFNF
ncbi:DUF6268 family outer membrane beta-barrel protein [Ascidiimonas aurantiaca]|uniref:DUF6268 family outer membrane beta-barrel protein n=1 Tax=Ascidiimonas aurantiaca TaxID=1685432 RepID=UPI0030EE00C7